MCVDRFACAGFPLIFETYTWFSRPPFVLHGRRRTALAHNTPSFLSPRACGFIRFYEYFKRIFFFFRYIDDHCIPLCTWACWYDTVGRLVIYCAWPVNLASDRGFALCYFLKKGWLKKLTLQKPQKRYLLLYFFFCKMVFWLMDFMPKRLIHHSTGNSERRVR